MSDIEDQTNQMLDTEDQTNDKMSEDTEEQTNNNNNNDNDNDDDNNNKEMTDTEDPDKFAEEIIDSGVVRKTVKRSYIIQEVSIYQNHK